MDMHVISGLGLSFGSDGLSMDFSGRRQLSQQESLREDHRAVAVGGTAPVGKKMVNSSKQRRPRGVLISVRPGIHSAPGADPQGAVFQQATNGMASFWPRVDGLCPLLSGTALGFAGYQRSLRSSAHPLPSLQCHMPCLFQCAWIDDESYKKTFLGKAEQNE
ncbi:hypothetical protein P7K49_012852 [Saguinus oedipus]|uniref:Uncharacterized protein n=1 Tax=Saguinus oedipus TaxID=9490 RepID=A0ABQ9VE82_SAGOE|nr:hypothetical protein P7K49_012852 [Saguinus oedipus]